MTKRKTKKKPAVKKRVVLKVKAKPKSKAKSSVMRREESFDEVKELRCIETYLNLVYGHLRKIQKEGGQDMLNLVLNYFQAKHDVQFFCQHRRVE